MPQLAGVRPPRHQPLYDTRHPWWRFDLRIRTWLRVRIDSWFPPKEDEHP